MDGTDDRWVGGRRRVVGVGPALNVVVVLGTVVPAVLALAAPQVLYPEVGHGGRVFAAYFAVRNLVLAVALAWAATRRTPALLVPLLVVSGVVQALDVPVGWVGSPPGAVVGPVFAAVVQLVTAWRLGPGRPAPVGGRDLHGRAVP